MDRKFFLIISDQKILVAVLCRTTPKDIGKGMRILEFKYEKGPPELTGANITINYLHKPNQTHYYVYLHHPCHKSLHKTQLSHKRKMNPIIKSATAS